MQIQSQVLLSTHVGSYLQLIKAYLKKKKKASPPLLVLWLGPRASPLPQGRGTAHSKPTINLRCIKHGGMLQGHTIVIHKEKNFHKVPHLKEWGQIWMHISLITQMCCCTVSICYKLQIPVTAIQKYTCTLKREGEISLSLKGLGVEVSQVTPDVTIGAYSVHFNHSFITFSNPFHYLSLHCLVSLHSQLQCAFFSCFINMQFFLLLLFCVNKTFT